jgi:hypothetical protein
MDGVAEKKKKKPNLDVKNNFARISATPNRITGKKN